MRWSFFFCPCENDQWADIMRRRAIEDRASDASHSKIGPALLLITGGSRCLLLCVPFLGNLMKTAWSLARDSQDRIIWCWSSVDCTLPLSHILLHHHLTMHGLMESLLYMLLLIEAKQHCHCIAHTWSTPPS